jgi:hypothetical protein
MPIYKVTKVSSVYVLAKNTDDAESSFDDAYKISEYEYESMSSKRVVEKDVPKEDLTEIVYDCNCVFGDEQMNLKDLFDIKKLL